MTRLAALVGALLAVASLALPAHAFWHGSPAHGGGFGTCPVASGSPATATVSTTVNLNADCVISGNLTVTTGGTLTMLGHRLTVAGNVSLDHTGQLNIDAVGSVHATLYFPQTFSGQYKINLLNSSVITFRNSNIITSLENGSCTHNTVGITTQDTAQFNSFDSGLNTGKNNSGAWPFNMGCGSWVLGNIQNSSSTLAGLVMSCTVPSSATCINLPTEVFPTNSAQVNILNATFGEIYMLFQQGASANVNLPNQYSAGNTNFDFTQLATSTFPGINLKNSNAGFAIQSYQGSTANLIGTGSTGTPQVRLQISYFIVGNTGNSVLNNLPVNGKFGTGVPGSGTPVCVSDGGSAARTLCFYNAVLPTFPWQVYPSDQNGFLVTIQNSKINELGAICSHAASQGGTAVNVAANNVVFEYANLAAVVGNNCPGSTVNVTNSTIWSSPVETVGGGVLNISNSTFHGVVTTSNGTGSSITISSSTEGFNGIPGQSCNTNPPPVDGSGNPLCNPQAAITTCSSFTISGGGAITGALACTPAPYTSPTVAGTATVGQTLTVTPAAWYGCPASIPCTLARQWQNEGTAIGGQTGLTYALQSTDLGSLVGVMETATANMAYSGAVNGTGAAYSGLSGPVIGTTVFYVSSSGGNDSNSGTSSGSPWQTIGKVNTQSASFSPGTSVLFKRGDVWDRSTGPTIDNRLAINSVAGASGNPIVYDAYGTGPKPTIDGSADGSQTSQWQASGTPNVWQSVQTFAPIGGPGTNGLPFFKANDVGNILWAFSPLGGSAPAEANDALFGRMVGAGTGGVWYSPGEGQTTLAANAVSGQWNFNTDNNKVQIYSTSNPAAAFPGLRLVMDGAGFSLGTGTSYAIIQNINFQYLGAALAGSIQSSNVIVRDCVFQWIGGGNIGGSSGANSRGGDGIDPENIFSNVLIERNYFYQSYDGSIAPQLINTGAHDNLTIRNNIFHKFGVAISEILQPSVATGQNGLNIYNNTSYGVGSWSSNQRPNGFPVVDGIQLHYNINLTVQNVNIENNAFSALKQFTAFFFNPPLFDLSFISTLTWDYNHWLSSPTPSMVGETGGGGNLTMASWKSTYGFDPHGLLDVDPQFTNPGAANFTPLPGSPLRNAGANLVSSGVVWDFFKQPRPATGPFTLGAIQ